MKEEGKHRVKGRTGAGVLLGGQEGGFTWQHLAPPGCCLLHGCKEDGKCKSKARDWHQHKVCRGTGHVSRAPPKTAALQPKSERLRNSQKGFQESLKMILEE